MRISVVIPVHEDRAELATALAQLAEADEIIVVDSSTHDPVQRADLPEGATLVRSELANRAAQQNAGAERATGEGMLFLHADTRLPAGALAAVRAALEDAEVAGGGFERFFDSPSRFLEWTCGLAAWRSRRWGWFLGDQAIFARREPFRQAGGYRALTCFEDYDLCRRLKRFGRLRCLQPAALSSARRFDRDGAVWRTAKDLALTVVYCVFGAKLFRAERKGR